MAKASPAAAVIALAATIAGTALVGRMVAGYAIEIPGQPAPPVVTDLATAELAPLPGSNTVADE